MKRYLTLATLAFAVSAVPAAAQPLSAAPAPTATSATTCATAWGSLPEYRTGTRIPSLVGVRSGRHACFDRVVFDFASRINGYRVNYGPVYREGSGTRMYLTGTDISVVLDAKAYNAYGGSTIKIANPSRMVNTYGYRTLRQVAWGGSFEGKTTIGIGVRARLPFRTFILNDADGGSRLVIDIAHTW